MHTFQIVLGAVVIAAFFAFFAWGIDWFFGDALPSGSADDVLDISDAVLDATFDGEHL
jgi:hypothetical protein